MQVLNRKECGAEECEAEECEAEECEASFHSVFFPVSNDTAIPPLLPISGLYLLLD